MGKELVLFGGDDQCFDRPVGEIEVCWAVIFLSIFNEFMLLSPVETGLQL